MRVGAGRPRKRFRAEVVDKPDLFDVFPLYPATCCYITNVVVKCTLNQTVDKARFFRAFPCSKMNIGSWGAVTYRQQEPMLSASIYDNSIMITGATSVLGARYNSEIVLDMLRQCGYPDLRIREFVVTNMASSVTFDFAIDIPAYNARTQASVYLPHNFIGSKEAGQNRQAASNVTMTLYERSAVCAGYRSSRDFAYDFNRAYVQCRAHARGA